MFIINNFFLFAVFALAKLMNAKEDQSQLSAIARYLVLCCYIFNFKPIEICVQLELPPPMIMGGE